MKPPINLLSILVLFGAIQGIFFALVLARLRRGNRIANRFLAGILFIFSISLVDGFLSVTYSAVRFPYLLGIEWPMIFMYGPFVYFYVKTLTGPQWKIERWKLYTHFIPAVLMYIYLVPFFLADPELKVSAWLEENGHLKNYTPVVDPILFVAILQIAGYLVLSLHLLKFHSQNIQQNFSSIEKISLSWLRTLIIVFFCLLCMYTFFAIFSQFYGIYKESEYLLNLMIALSIYIMGYKGITQPEIFTPIDNAGSRLECKILPGDGAPTITEEPGSRTKLILSEIVHSQGNRASGNPMSEKSPEIATSA
jgi:hypothetical protein